jgi:aspartyl-tRNA(Asn)/glutamyl-tRNA(Gln) amidotransferase subunit A
MAKSVVDCAATDAVMAGEAVSALQPVPLSGLRLGIWQGMPFEGIDQTVLAAWSAAVMRLGKAGVRLSDETIALVDDMVQVNAKGGIAPAEAFSIHRERLKRDASGIDPNIRQRIERGGQIAAADYIDMMQARARLVRAMDACMTELDALVLPTVPIVAPTLAEVATAEGFGRRNATLLRNTNPINFFDLCAISLPLPRQGGLSSGLMLVARNGHDQRLLDIAASVERLMAG